MKKVSHFGVLMVTVLEAIISGINVVKYKIDMHITIKR